MGREQCDLRFVNDVPGPAYQLFVETLDHGIPTEVSPYDQIDSLSAVYRVHSP